MQNSEFRVQNEELKEKNVVPTFLSETIKNM